MGELMMVFLPKGEREGGVAGNVIRDCACTRPLAMANTNAKLLSSLCCMPLNQLSRDAVAPLQKC
eukprot:8606121-Pyramimonas_sp.AAC.1